MEAPVKAARQTGCAAFLFSDLKQYTVVFRNARRRRKPDCFALREFQARGAGNIEA
jgi:hypothetical protein